MFAGYKYIKYEVNALYILFINIPTSFFTVVVWGVKLGIIIGQLHASNNQVILLIRSVSAQNEPVYAVILPLGPGREKKKKKVFNALMPISCMFEIYYRPNV